ncbi:guanine nucleotide-binding protein G(I)/G(S)/G(O) subunit gamma-7 isoform X2 [Dermochelys coriacea]|nr:guanine nucleotide-binding protein G(I)/G(S)/G(O) subunit gamma-7 isoform X2 [Dermochelys coriacea]
MKSSGHFVHGCSLDVGTSVPQKSKTNKQKENLWAFSPLPLRWSSAAVAWLNDYQPVPGKVSSVKPEKSAILVLKTVVLTSSKQVITSELIMGYEFPVAFIAPTTLCNKTACQKIRNNPGTVRKVL